MFRLNPAPEFDAKVPLSMPGIADPVDVAFRFRHKTRDALAAWIVKAEKLDADMLHEAIVGWGVTGDEGEATPYSLGALQQLLQNYPAADQEIFKAYIAEIGRSKRKN